MTNFRFSYYMAAPFVVILFTLVRPIAAGADRGSEEHANVIASVYDDYLFLPLMVVSLEKERVPPRDATATIHIESLVIDGKLIEPLEVVVHDGPERLLAGRRMGVGERRWIVLRSTRFALRNEVWELCDHEFRDGALRRRMFFVSKTAIDGEIVYRNRYMDGSSGPPIRIRISF